VVNSASTVPLPMDACKVKINKEKEENISG
jgi:hypothetical protein